MGSQTHRLLFLGVCLLTIAGLAATAIGSPSAAPRGGDAGTRIVWSRIDAKQTRQQLVSARPDGKRLLELTHPAKHSNDIDAQISPDGTEVAFERDIGKNRTQLMLVDSDGHYERALDLGCSDPCAVDLTPTWFNDGSRLFFTRVVGPFDAPNHSARSAALQTMLPDGTDIQRFSDPGIDGTFEDYHAHYSPDGSYILFTRVRDKPLDLAAFRMNADGSDVRQLTPWGLGGDLSDISPATSGPTKDLVVFETYGMGAPEGKSQNIATLPATCGSLSDCRKKIHYLTDYDGGRSAAFNPAWSPNGRKIAYTKFKGDDQNCCVGDIYTMRADGTHRKAVSKSPLFEYRPDWGVAP